MHSHNVEGGPVTSVNQMIVDSHLWSLISTALVLYLWAIQVFTKSTPILHTNN